MSILFNNHSMINFYYIEKNINLKKYFKMVFENKKKKLKKFLLR